MVFEVLQAFFLIFIAEMGDKTQILAMAFATKYPVKKVLLGIMIGSFVNHGIAVALGSQLTRIVPIKILQIIAGIAFLIFAFWSLKAEKDDGEENREVKYGAIITVALAFFIGELGDKTQLTAITLASSARSPALVLLGTVTGMVATGSLGIVVGKKLGDKVPEFHIKAAAAVIFLVFGTAKLYSALPTNYVTSQSILVYLTMILIPFTYFISRRFNTYRQGVQTKFERKSKELYDYYHFLECELNHLCLGRDYCGNCEGKKCPVGLTKELLAKALNDQDEAFIDDVHLSESYENKPFDSEISQGIIEETKKVSISVDQKNKYLQQIIKNMERLKK